MYECNIASKLIELRLAQGVTQEDVANALSVSNKTISKWENGSSEPNLSMLLALSRYYHVSTDCLLGLEEDDRKINEVIRAEFQGIGRKNMALKAFEMVKAIFPSGYYAAEFSKEDICAEVDVIPSSDKSRGGKLSLHEIFNLIVNSDDVNIAVMQLRNKSNFAWLSDEEKREKIVRLFDFLASSDALKICKFIHTTTCSETFTVDYIAKNTGVTHEKTQELLQRSCEVGLCTKITAHLKSGEITVYGSSGNGIILALISLAYEQMCHRNGYGYNYRGICKMIGGKKDELV